MYAAEVVIATNNQSFSGHRDYNSENINLPSLVLLAPVRFLLTVLVQLTSCPFHDLWRVSAFFGLFMTQSAFRKAVLQQRKHWSVKFMVPLAEASNNTPVRVLWTTFFSVAARYCLICVSSRPMSFHGLSLVLNVKLRMSWCGIIIIWRIWAQNPPQAKTFSTLLLSTSFPSITIERQARGLLSLNSCQRPRITARVPTDVRTPHASMLLSSATIGATMTTVC